MLNTVVLQENIDIIYISLIALLWVIAAYVIIKRFMYQGNKILQRTQLLSTAKVGIIAFSKRYANEAEKQLLERAGFKSINEKVFKILRDAFVVIVFIALHLNWYLYGGNYPIIKVLLVIALYISLSMKQGFPLFRVLKQFEKAMNAKKNKQVFMLYAVLLNEYAIHVNKSPNLYSMFKKYRAHFPELQEAMDLAIYYWRKGSDYALTMFSRELDTSHAKELAKVLKDVDKLSSQSAYQLLDKKYSIFNKIRMEEYRRYLKDRALIGYFVIFVPVLSIVVNFGYIYYLEYKELMIIVNQL